MKIKTPRGVFAFAVWACICQLCEAQGTTTFLSNLAQSSTGSVAVGSDSWSAGGFFTGTNAGGYTLSSVQLAMLNAAGNPTGFSVMLYSEANNPGGVFPGSSLITFSGSSNPATAGVYTYTATGGLSLAPNTYYFIVAAAGSLAANGAFEWSFANPSSYQSTDHWSASFSWGSVNGSPPSWSALSSGSQFDFLQFAINATAAPEPGTLGLLALGGLAFGLKRWNEKKRS